MSYTKSLGEPPRHLWWWLTLLLITVLCLRFSVDGSSVFTPKLNFYPYFVKLKSVT